MYIMQIFVHTYHIWVPNKTWKVCVSFTVGYAVQEPKEPQEVHSFETEWLIHISIYKMFVVNDGE